MHLVYNVRVVDETVTESAKPEACSARPRLPPQLREVITECGPFVCRSLRSLGIQNAELDDAVQEVFLVVFQRFTDYEERGRGRAWLYSICSRVARNHRRRLGRRRETAFVDTFVEATQLERLSDREALELGQRLIDELPPAQREAFVLYEVEDLSIAEVARALQCPLQTAYSRLRKARAKIVAEVERLAAAAPDAEPPPAPEMPLALHRSTRSAAPRHALPPLATNLRRMCR